MKLIFEKTKKETKITKFIEEKVEKLIYENPDEKKIKIKQILQDGNFDAGISVKPWFILLPNQKLKQIWDIFICIWIILSLLLVPINLGWNVECINNNNGESLHKLSIATSFFFFFDIGINCITGYINESKIYVFKIPSIIQNYLFDGLIIDVLSSLPYDVMNKFDMEDCLQTGISSSKYLVFFFFLRFLKLNKYFEILERFFSKFALQIRFAKLFVSTFYLGHAIGNIYCGLSPALRKFIFQECEIYSSTDINKILCQRNFLKNNFSNIYSYSLYVGTTMMVGEDYLFETNWEILIQFFAVFLSTIITATIYSNVTLMLAKLSSGISPVLQTRIDKINNYMKFMNIDDNFINKIEDYHVSIWNKQRNIIYEKDFFDDMSWGLRKTILLNQWKYSFFAESKFLSIIGEEFITEMVIYLEPKICVKYDVIVKEGELDNDVYLLSKSAKCIVTIVGKNVACLSYGDYFGEISIFLRSRKRTATVTSHSDSDYLRLDGNRYEIFLRNFPEDCQVIREKAIKCFMSNIKVYNSNLYSKLVPSNNIKDYLFRKNIYLTDEEEDKYYDDIEFNKKNFVDSKLYNIQIGLLNDRLKKVLEKIK